MCGTFCSLAGAGAPKKTRLLNTELQKNKTFENGAPKKQDFYKRSSKKKRLLKTELQENTTFIEKNSFLEAPAARRGPRKSSRLTLYSGPPYSPTKLLNICRLYIRTVGNTCTPAGEQHWRHHHTLRSFVGL